MVENPYASPSSSAEVPLQPSSRAVLWIGLLGLIFAALGLMNNVPRLINPPEDINPRYYVCLLFRVPSQIILLVGSLLLLVRRPPGPLLMIVYAWFSIAISSGWFINFIVSHVTPQLGNDIGAPLVSLAIGSVTLLLDLIFPVLVLLFLRGTNMQTLER